MARRFGLEIKEIGAMIVGREARRLAIGHEITSPGVAPIAAPRHERDATRIPKGRGDDGHERKNGERSDSALEHARTGNRGRSLARAWNTPPGPLGGRLPCVIDEQPEPMNAAPYGEIP